MVSRHSSWTSLPSKPSNGGTTWPEWEWVAK